MHVCRLQCIKNAISTGLPTTERALEVRITTRNAPDPGGTRLLDYRLRFVRVTVLHSPCLTYEDACEWVNRLLVHGNRGRPI